MMETKKSYKKHIAVVSKHREISMFFELEALACGCSVRVFTAPPQDISEFDFVVVDLDTGYCFSQNDMCQIAAVCRGKKTMDMRHFDYVWDWPLSIETVREAYDGGALVKNSDAVIPSEKSTIYLLPEKDHTIVYRNQTIGLTESEWIVLKLLADRFGATVSREELSTLFEGTKGNVADVHICHLRKKLEAPFGIRLIETVRGKGYVLKAKIVYL